MLSVIIPLFNEQENIGKFHLAMTNILRESGLEFEILYVDDGSTDGSRAEIEKAGAAFVFHDRNRGYGAALKTGFRHTQGDYIAIIDCDNTYDPADIPRLYKELSTCDMVVGSRPNTFGLGNLSKSFLRALASYAVSYPIPDLNSGLRIFSRELAMRLIKTLPNGFSLTSTITLGALYTPYRVRYVPVIYGKRCGKSKIRPIDAFVNFTLLIARMIVLFNPLKFFLPLAFVCGTVGIVFLIRDLFASNVAQTSLLMIINGFIFLAIGLLAEAIRCRD